MNYAERIQSALSQLSDQSQISLEMANAIQELQQNVSTIQSTLDSVMSSDSTNPNINTLKEIYNFLANAKDTQTIADYVNSITKEQFDALNKAVDTINKSTVTNVAFSNNALKQTKNSKDSNILTLDSNDFSTDSNGKVSVKHQSLDNYYDKDTLDEAQKEFSGEISSHVNKSNKDATSGVHGYSTDNLYTQAVIQNEGKSGQSIPGHMWLHVNVTDGFDNNTDLNSGGWFPLYEAGSEENASFNLGMISNASAQKLNMLKFTSDNKIDKTLIPTDDIDALNKSLQTTNDNVSDVSDRVTTLENRTLLDQLSYGIQWTYLSGNPKRVGNMSMHKTLPIQNSLKGCIFKGDKVIYYLDPQDWTKKADGSGDSKLDGTDGDVGVHHMKFYIKSWTSVDGDDTQRMVRISPFKIDDSWIEVPEGIIGAYRLVRDNTDSSKPLGRSIINATAACRGGSGSRSSRDVYLETQPIASDLNKPKTDASRSTFRTWARNNNIELLDYVAYKFICFWLPVIEYCSFSVKSAYNPELSTEGYVQGGLGQGVTTIDGNLWWWFNGYYPLIPNGFTNEFGNYSGVKATEAFEYTAPSANRGLGHNDWGVENSVATRNGTDNSVTFTQINFNNSTSKRIYHTNQFKAVGTYSIEITGLTDSGITLTFRTGNTVITTATTDGTIEVNFPDNTSEREIYASVAQTSSNITCNIKLTAKAPDNVDMTRTIPSLSVNRYRGIEQLWGDIWTNVDGFIGLGLGDNKEGIYTTDNPELYSDSNYSALTLAGIMSSSGWVSDFELGNTAEIIPHCTGRNIGYWSWLSSALNTLYTLFLGGGASYSGYAGVGCFHAIRGVGYAWTHNGARVYKRIKK